MTAGCAPPLDSESLPGPGYPVPVDPVGPIDIDPTIPVLYPTDGGEGPAPNAPGDPVSIVGQDLTPLATSSPADDLAIA
jgi:hypothetical protein